MTVRTLRLAASLLGLLFTGLVFLGLFMVGSAFSQQSELAQQSETSKPFGKVTEYGIYSEQNELLKKTTIIPNGAAVRFGFCFEADIQFFDDERYMMVEALEHPPVTGKEGGENAGYSVPRLFKVRGGIAYGCSGYRARDAADLRPGVWKFTISDGPDDVVVQEFTIQ
ncbi:MAG: DUF3859 domain-containing protein [Betaproteobacteria bacterium]|nr:MAG: DUF3859 domain-containing protein [Betaproteobacteria bacterium]